MTLPADPLKWAVKAFGDERNNLYQTYARYLAGDHPLVFATARYRSTFGQLFQSLAYNRCELVVDAHADRLQVAGFGADAEPLATAAQAIWDGNRMDVREGHVEQDAFGLGDSYVIVEMHPERAEVQVWTQDPRSVRVHHSDEAPGELDLAAKRWAQEDGRTRLTLYFADRIEKYVSRTRTPGGVQINTGWERFVVDGEEWPVRLGVTDTVPVFHFANNGRTNAYGVSELRNVIPLQDGTNKTLADLLVSMEFAAFPQRVLMGVEKPFADDEVEKYQSQLEQFIRGVDRMLTLFRNGDGTNPQIGEFSAVNIGQYLGVLEFMDKAIARVTKVPTHYLGISGGFPSGRSLRIAEAPFIAKIEDRQRAFGQVWADMARYGLRLEGRTVEPGALRVNWKSAAALSREDELDVALQKASIGFPFEQLLMELGYEPDQIATIQAEKQRLADEAMTAFDRGVVGMGDDEIGVVA